VQEKGFGRNDETMEMSHYAVYDGLSSSIVVRATIEILLSPALAGFQLPCVKMLFESESQNEAEKLSSLVDVTNFIETNIILIQQ
jgi:hypothetical protein